MTCHALTHEIEVRGHINLPVCPMKGVGYWSRMSTSTTDGSDFKKFSQSVRPETATRRKRRKRKKLERQMQSFLHYTQAQETFPCDIFVDKAIHCNRCFLCALTNTVTISLFSNYLIE